MLAKIRRLWLNIHLWIGVALAIFLIPLGLSGAMIVWQPEVDRVLEPGHYAFTPGPALKPSAYLAAATAAFKGRAEPTQLRLPVRPGDPVTVAGRTHAPAASGQRPPGLAAVLDPVAARVLDVADPRQSPIGFIHRLHGNMLIEGWGRPFVGWLGWGMFLNCLTGLWLWWPRGVFSRALRWRRTPSTTNNLHHLTGVLIVIPLAILSLTGIYIAFPKTSHALVGAPPPQERAQGGDRGGDRGGDHGGAGGHRHGGGHHSPVPPAPSLSVDAIASAAVAKGGTVSTISLPERSGRPWRVQVKTGDTAPLKEVSVNAVTGEASPAAPRGPGAADPFSRFVRQTHEGENGGPLWKWIVTLTGLAPSVLAVSGIIVWLRKRQRIVAD